MFTDKNGVELNIGDYIVPDEGMELLLVSVAYVPDFGGECLFGQQVLDPLAFSVLTQENLSSQWSKTNPPEEESVLANLRVHTITETDKTKYENDEDHPVEIETEEDEEISDVRKVKINE